ncbi:hypothetical protein RJ640_024862 [Escallonia rubra]|uniref:Retrovirus-related Pol polyprotein from transposon TNT 1-94 n=1 Tax=Escallonia rubra TaxID=112253 RepID=A0AA88U6U2_9ASTE|nr:hypothetical protein RJ640_024862 [Escallonia rubra]
MVPNISTKYDLERFDGSNDFSLWRMNMHVLLIQQRLLKPLKENQGLPKTMSTNKKEDMLEIAHSALLLCLADNMLRKVFQETTGVGLWLKLERLYMTNSLTNCLYLKQRLYTLRMKECTSINDHLDEYKAAGGVMRIMKGALVVMKWLKQDSLYLLQGSTITGAAATTLSFDIDCDTTKFWHMHLGHMIEKEGGVDCYGKDQGVREKVELEVRAPDFLPKIPIDEEDGSHSTKYGYMDMVAYALNVAEGSEVEESATYKEAIKSRELTQVNEQPQEQQYSIAIYISRREIRAPQKFGYADMVAYALSVAEGPRWDKLVKSTLRQLTYKQ